MRVRYGPSQILRVKSRRTNDRLPHRNSEQNKQQRARGVVEGYANAVLGSVTNQCDRLISEEPDSSRRTPSPFSSSSPL